MQDDREIKGSPTHRILKREQAPLFPIQLSLTVGARMKSRSDIGTENNKAHKRHLKNTERYLFLLLPSSSATSLDDESDTPAVAKVSAGEYTDIMS